MSTIRGFEDIVRVIPQATQHQRGERVIETAFFSRARLEGNDLGYDTIAAAGNNATVLHWIRNTGQVNDGELLLVDAGSKPILSTPPISPGRSRSTGSSLRCRQRWITRC